MADLLSKDMLADLILNIINILVLFFVTKSLLYKPVKKFLNARAEKLNAAQKDAEDAKAQAEESKAKYDAVLSDAEQVKTEAVEKAEAEARAAAERIIAQAKEQAAETVEKGEKGQPRSVKKCLPTQRMTLSTRRLTQRKNCSDALSQMKTTAA